MLLHRARVPLMQEGSSVLQGLYSILGLSFGSINEELPSFGGARCKEQCCVCKGFGALASPTRSSTAWSRSVPANVD